MGSKIEKSGVIWFTGLSGAGKTTLAKRLEEILLTDIKKVSVLDGDEIRAKNPQIGFSLEDRNFHVRSVAERASQLEKEGYLVLVSLISPFESSRAYARSLCSQFTEVYLNTPLDECERRDPKGLYKKARQGQICSFTGIDSPYEAPKNSELQIDTSELNIQQAVEMILEKIK